MGLLVSWRESLYLLRPKNLADLFKQIFGFWRKGLRLSGFWIALWTFAVHYRTFFELSRMETTHLRPTEIYVVRDFVLLLGMAYFVVSVSNKKKYDSWRGFVADGVSVVILTFFFTLFFKVGIWMIPPNIYSQIAEYFGPLLFTLGLLYSISLPESALKRSAWRSHFFVLLIYYPISFVFDNLPLCVIGVFLSLLFNFCLEVPLMLFFHKFFVMHPLGAELELISVSMKIAISLSYTAAFIMSLLPVSFWIYVFNKRVVEKG